MGGLDQASHAQCGKQFATTENKNLGGASEKEEVEVRNPTLQRWWGTKMDRCSLEVESADTPRHRQTYSTPQSSETELTVDGRVAQLCQKQLAPRTTLE